MSSPRVKEDTLVLYYKEINASSSNSTILLIHGAFSSGAEWDLVTPYLSDAYHLLLPDLPAHGRSEDVVPFSKELSARLLAELIGERALGGKAHVIGISLGAHVAIELASKYPQIVSAVFVSGYEVFASSQNIALGLWVSNRIESAIPRPVVRWLMDDTDILPGNCSLSLSRAVAQALCINEEQWPSPWPARTLIVAAGKSGILPTADHPQDAIKLWDIGRKANKDSKAYTHADMRHPWNRQAPELFAQTAKKWFEQAVVPDGFKEL